jgi:acyl carrier protein
MIPIDGSGISSAVMLQRVRECLQTVLTLSAEQAAAIGPETTPLTVPRWTSLAHVQLILELEQAFGVTFEADEIAELASVGAIVDALGRAKT